MKIKKHVLPAVMGALILSSATAFAAEAQDGFSDVPQDHWAYSAVTDLARQGLVEGYEDGTFQGGRTMSRYEMAVVIEKAKKKVDEKDYMNQALVEKLEREFKDEVARLDARIDAVEKEVNRVKFSGFFRAKYDNDHKDGLGNDGNKHFFMNLEASMKVSDMWTAHLQSETNRNYYRNAKDNGGMGTVQRVWLEGDPAKNLHVEMGSKWWGIGYQNTLWGHAAAGAKLTYKFNDDVNASIFGWRPNQDQWFNLAQANGMGDYYDEATIYGANVTAKLGHAVEAQLTGTKVTGDSIKERFGMDNAWAVDVKADLAKNVELLANYTRTNADRDNNTQALRLNYKRTDLNNPGSFQAYARYVKFGRFGDLGHDEEWGSLASDSKGWFLGFKYVPWKNVEWETFFTRQDGITTSATRNMLRTQIDFHF